MEGAFSLAQQRVCSVFLSLQSCHRPGGDGFRPEQTKNDPTCCLQGACQGDSTSLLEFLETENRVCVSDVPDEDPAVNRACRDELLVCVLCAVTLVFSVCVCVSAGRPWCEGLDPHQRQKQRYHVCWPAGQWENHNLLQGVVTRLHIK